jgi:transcriptional regulator with XRE-family HTH domain
MYPVYHEMDIQQFVDRMNELWESYYIDTNLKRIRMLSGYSQRELSELSGVSLRQIQLFEQRQRNINHTKAENVFRLAKILNCKCEDLIEI